jgi:opacity protein-like surface antigen
MKCFARHALLTLLLLLFCTSDARGQMKVGVRAGVDSWRYRPLVGVEARLDVAGLVSASDLSFGLVLNPSLEYRHIWGYDGFANLDRTENDWNGQVYQFDANALLKLKDFGSDKVSPYLGGGLMFSRVSYDESIRFIEEDEKFEDSDGDTTFGLNLLGGVNLQVHDFLTPFARTRLTISPRTEFELWDGPEGNDRNRVRTGRFKTWDGLSLTVTAGVLIGV